MTLLAGCATTPPSTFYALAPLASGQMHSSAYPRLTLGIGPVRFARYLDRAQIVRRASANRLDFNEFERWGGSLEDEFTRVWGENLGILLGTSRVMILPTEWRAPLDVRIAAEVLAFEGTPDGQARLKVRWMLHDPSDEEPSLVRVNEYAGTLSVPADTEALIAALSALLADFSRDVAEAVIALRR